MFRKLSIEELEKKVKAIEHYLGPRLNYNSDRWPDNPIHRWLLEYSMILKMKLYKRIKLQKLRASKKTQSIETKPF